MTPRPLWDSLCWDWTSDLSALQQKSTEKGTVVQQECCFYRLYGWLGAVSIPVHDDPSMRTSGDSDSVAVRSRTSSWPPPGSERVEDAENKMRISRRVQQLTLTVLFVFVLLDRWVDMRFLLTQNISLTPGWQIFVNPNQAPLYREQERTKAFISQLLKMVRACSDGCSTG